MPFPASPTDGDRHREANTTFIADGGKWRRLKGADRVAAHDSGQRNLDVQPHVMRPGGARGLIELDYVFAPQSNEEAHLQIESTAGWFNWKDTAEDTGYMVSGGSSYGDNTWLGGATSGLQLHWDTGWYRFAFNKAVGLNVKINKYDATSVYIRWELFSITTTGNGNFVCGSVWAKVAIESIVRVRIAVSNITRYGSVARVI